MGTITLNDNSGILIHKDKKLQVLELEPKDEWSYHFWFGIKCGYPLCCIIWYCDTMTNKGKQEDSLFERVYREEVMFNPILKETKSDHNECPDCLLRRLTNG